MINGFLNKDWFIFLISLGARGFEIFISKILQTQNPLYRTLNSVVNYFSNLRVSRSGTAEAVAAAGSVRTSGREAGRRRPPGTRTEPGLAAAAGWAWPEGGALTPWAAAAAAPSDGGADTCS